MLGNIIEEKTPVSFYQPSKEVADLTKNVQKDYAQGDDILNTSYEELNNYSPIERTNKDQRTFNSFVDESIDDPRNAWKWRGTRSLARNKAMATHAHLTAGFVLPIVIAQNESQQEDIDSADVMASIMEWMTINSNYRPSFLLATQGMLVNPVTYLEADFKQVYQTITELTEKGYEKKEIIDEVLSGFNANVLSVNQVRITNVRQQNIQRQRAIIKTRYIEYSEAEAIYKDHPNWKYLTLGIKSVFNGTDGLFYDVKDDNNPNLIQEDTWLNRRQDGEVCFLNGIYFGNAESVDWNPIKHRDNRNAPKYNITPFGYERINEHFFFYKSLINRVGWDDKLLDAIYEVQMNREFIDLETPLLVSGDDNISDVIFPGAVISSKNENVKATPIIPPSSGNGYRAMQKIESSMSEATISDTTAGQLPSGSQTATAVSQASINARILLSGVKQTLAESVRQFGELMCDIIIQHITAPQVDEISGNISYRTLLLSDQTVDGKKVSKRIRFDDALIGREMTESNKKEYLMKMLTQIGYPDNKEHLYMVNPHLFSKKKYLITIEADSMEPKTKEFRQAMMERLYALLRKDPIVQPEMLVRELVQTFFNTSKTNKLISSNTQSIMGGEATQNTPNIPNLPALPSNIIPQ